MPRISRHKLLLLPVLGSLLILLPRILNSHFGLLDDGLTIKFAREMAINPGYYLAESQSGRFRPIYWISNTILYRIAGDNSQIYFLANALLLILLVACLMLLIKQIGGNDRQAILAGSLFILSGPIVENYYTLSKAEPLQLLFLLLSLNSLLWISRVSSRYIIVLLWLAVLGLIFLADSEKETSIVVTIISLVWLLLFVRQGGQKQYKSIKLSSAYFIASAIASTVFLLWRQAVIATNIFSGNYTNNFNFNFWVILSTSFRWEEWLIRDFAYLIPIILFVIYISRRNPFPYAIILKMAWVWVIGWLLVFLPWIYTPEYYLLPLGIGMSLIGGFTIDWIIETIQKGSQVRFRRAIACLILSTVLFVFSLGINYSNARVQLIVDQVNSDLLSYIAVNVPENATLIVDYPENHEYLDEMRLHLAEFFRRTDLNVISLDKYVLNPILTIPNNTFILSNRVKNSIPLSVRLGIYPIESEQRAEALPKNIPDLSPVHIDSLEFETIYVDLNHLPCLIKDHWLGCGNDTTVFHVDVFIYAWSIYNSR